MVGNEISNVDNLYRREFPNLQSMQLDRNRITSFCIGDSSKWPKLTLLRLAQNNIKIIFMAANPPVKSLALEDNPLACDDLFWLHQCRCIKVSSGIPGFIMCSDPRFQITTRGTCCDVATVTYISAPAGTIGTLFHYKDRISRYKVPMLKIRRSRDRLISNMGIPIHLFAYWDSPLIVKNGIMPTLFSMMP